MTIQLEITSPNGESTKVGIKAGKDRVLQGGKTKIIAVPCLDEFEVVPDHRWAFEVAYFCYVEGNMVEGDIESSDDEILATWKFLVDGKSIGFAQLEKALNS
jgi:hypothetical protein